MGSLIGGEMTLGQNLVNARKTAGISLEDLSNRTNIRESLLKEFEANKFINAGGDTYARGHLKTIARVIGIDPEPLLVAFDEEHAQEHRPIHDQLVENNVTLGIPEKSKITYKQLIAVSVVGIVAIFGISFIANSTNGGPSAGTKSTAKPTATAKPSASASPRWMSSARQREPRRPVQPRELALAVIVPVAGQGPTADPRPAGRNPAAKSARRTSRRRSRTPSPG